MEILASHRRLPLLHISIADAQYCTICLIRNQVGVGLGGTGNIRFGNNFDQGRAERFRSMRVFAGPDRGSTCGVFFHVNPFYADPFGTAVFQLNINMAVMADGLVELGNLIAFGHVRIEIVFPGKNGPGCYLTVGGPAHFNDVIDQVFIQQRQGTGMPQTQRGYLSVRLVTEPVGDRCKSFAFP